MDDDEIIARGGTQEDINKYAHDNGACGLPYDGKCDECGVVEDKELRDKLCELMIGCRYSDLSSHDSQDVDEAMQAIQSHYEAKIVDELEILDAHTIAENKFAYHMHAIIQARLNELKKEKH